MKIGIRCRGDGRADGTQPPQGGALFFDMARAGPPANDVLRMKAPKLPADDFAEQAQIRHVSKDIGLVCEEATQYGAWLPVAAANRDLFAEAMRRGQASDDDMGIIKVLRTGADA